MLHDNVNYCTQQRAIVALIYSTSNSPQFLEFLEYLLAVLILFFSFLRTTTLHHSITVLSFGTFSEIISISKDSNFGNIGLRNLRNERKLKQQMKHCTYQNIFLPVDILVESEPAHMFYTLQFFSKILDFSPHIPDGRGSVS